MRRHLRFDGTDPVRLPRPPVPVALPTAFVFCPAAPLPWQQWVYQRAFEQAQASATPSLPERDLLGVWN